MKNNNKSSTKKALGWFALTLIGLAFPVQINAATVAYGTPLGSFLLADGSSPLLSGGGISVGFFTGSTLPTKAQLAAITSNPYSALVSTYNYVDLRNLADAVGSSSFQSSGSWDFSSGWTGATLNVPNSPTNYTTAINGNDISAAFAGGSTGTATALWAFAFNSGNYANQFSGSTQWAAVTANELGGATNDWLFPTSAENIQLSQISTAGEILIGTDSANNVLMANVIPEPSSTSLLALGVAGLVALRARRKS
jgi:hypothetical protein